MKTNFNLDLEMNSILQSENVKIASVDTINKIASKDDISSFVVKFAEMALELDKRGMFKTSESLKKAARSLVEDSSDPQVKNIGQLYGLVK